MKQREGDKLNSVLTELCINRALHYLFYINTLSWAFLPFFICLLKKNIYICNVHAESSLCDEEDGWAGHIRKGVYLTFYPRHTESRQFKSYCAIKQ